MIRLPIFQFKPIVKELVWGGRRLETVLGKTLPAQSTFGESWEVVDLPKDQSEVAAGDRRGETLAALREKERASLLGSADLLEGRFPLLFKFIDACQTLSVQVHPDEAACARIGGAARPKTEAWHIIDREPGAVLYVGLKEGVTKAQFADAIADGTVASLLHEVEVSAGDFVYLPAGTIHAIGAGILLAEVQQSSDTTYRVFDWNRVGLDGNPRELHIEEALVSTDFTTHGLPEITPPASGRPGVVSDFFVMETVGLAPGDLVTLGGEGLLVLMGVAGSGAARVTAVGEAATLRRGETRLVPACIASEVDLEATGAPITLLSVRIP
jgi:mannose-6-phosphate isomerase